MATEIFEAALSAFGGAVAGAVSAYAAVKEKMGELIARVSAAEKRGDEAMVNANNAHHRIDEHITDFHAK